MLAAAAGAARVAPRRIRGRPGTVFASALRAEVLLAEKAGLWTLG